MYLNLTVREGLKNPDMVEELQMKYAFLLEKYEKQFRPDDKSAFARLVMKLPQLQIMR